MKNTIIIFIIFWGFSANAQKPNHTEMNLDSTDVFGGFLENSQNLAVKMYQLVMDNKVKIYKDSLLKKELKGKEKQNCLSSEILMCFVLTENHEDSFYNYYYNPKSNFKININGNFIDFYSIFDAHYYMPLDKTLALLNDEDKTILGIWIKSLNGNVNEKTIQYYTQNYLKEKLESIYQMSLEDKISTFKNTSFELKYLPNEIKFLGEHINQFTVMRFGSDDPYDVIDSVIITPFYTEFLKGFKVIYHQHTDSNFQSQFQVTALGILYKHDEDTSKGYKNLYYLKPEDVFGMFSKKEKLLWDAMIQFQIFKRFEEE